MKTLLILTLAFAISQAHSTWEWSELISLEPQNIPGRLFKPVLLNNNRERIVGGEEVKPNSYPFQAGLFIHLEEGIGFCGGSIISENYILTAAHCVDNTKKVEVVLGAHRIRDEEEATRQKIEAVEFIVHKSWLPLLLQNDIALVKLPSAIEFNDYIKPIRLPSHSSSNNDITGDLGDVSGWGKDSDKSSTISPVLRHVNAEVISKRICNIFYFGLINDNHVCTSGLAKKGACSGDSGGPLTTTEDDNTKTLHGVVSFGISFGCEKRWPSVFTRVASYLEWIEENTDIVIRA